MSKTVYFYNVGLYLNGKLTDITLLDFIDEINNIQKDRSKVVRKIDDKISAIFRFVSQNEKDVRVIPFGKFRIDFKPYVGELTKSDLIPIDKEVIELVTMYYNNSYKFACITFNQNGLKIRDVENYLNTFLPSKSTEKWEVKFEPIIINKGLEKVKKTNQVKKISIELNLENSSKRFLNENIDIKFGFLKALTTSAEEELEANILKLEFGVGKKQKATMDLESILYLLNLLNIDAEYISSLEVTYKDNSNEKIDVVNLKKQNVELKDKILTNSSDKNPPTEIVSIDIKKIVEKHKQNIVRAYRKYWSNLVSEEMPKLILEPLDENKVKIQTKITDNKEIKDSGEKVS